MFSRAFAEYWKPDAPRRADCHGLPDGPAGALIVLLAWFALVSAYEYAIGVAAIGALPLVRWSGPVVLFAIALVSVRIVRTAEMRRLEARRREARESVFARRQAYLAARNYYVVDVIGTKRGPYTLEALVRWRERGKLDDRALVYIGSAADPVPFSRAAAAWRERWGDSAFDPPALRRAG